jgi:hypothetical protein
MLLSVRTSNLGDALEAPFLTNAATAWRAAVVLALALAGGPAAAADPKVPPAVETGNRVAIGIITRGFDYTRTELARLLARDGEGEVIAWDVPGEDRFPYDAEGDTGLVADIAAQLRAGAPVSLLAVKADPEDPVSLAKALAFLARTPATTVIVPMWSSQRSEWEPFEKAARHFNALKIVVRSCPDLPLNSETAVYPRDLALPNASLSPAGENDPVAAVLAYVAGLPCRRE